MRLIFISLLVVNIVVAVWGLLFSGSDSSPHHNTQAKSAAQLAGAPVSDKRIVLLSELSLEEGEGLGVVRKEFDTSKSQRLLDVDTGVETPDLCEMVGPFESQSKASELLERMSAIDVEASIEVMQFPAGTGYWVFLPPESDRKSALKRLAQLQSRGVDSYVIPKGEKKHGISLGMYTKKSLADARLQLARDLLLEPEVEIIERKYKEIWVMLKPKQAQKVSEITWSRILDDKKNLQRRENYCLDVAS